MMKLPLVSIILPVYNAEHTLGKTIDSIRNQTYTDWELLLINDGSTDKSGEICDRYQEVDSRIRVLTKTNGGVSTARNLGLKQAKGDWITFVDADDILAPEYVGTLSKYIKEDVDLIISGFKIKNDIEFRPDEEFINLRGTPNAIQKLIDIPYYLDTPWCKLYKRSLINQFDLRFDGNLKLCEDTLFCYQYLVSSRKIAITNHSLYLYDGIWGGKGKYNLTVSELTYSLGRFKETFDELTRVLGVPIDFHNKGYQLGKIDKMYEQYVDTDIHRMYESAYGKISLNEFLGKVDVSPLTIGMVRALRSVKEGNDVKSLNFLIQLKNFISIPISEILFQSTKQRIFYFLLDRLDGKNILTALKIYNYISK